MRIVWWTLGAIYAAFCLGAWATDFVTLQNQSTVYTVGCRNGHWEGERCTGDLVAARRYRFEALKHVGEVRSWFVSAPAQVSKYKGCDIQDGRNWSCTHEAAQSAGAVTLRLVQGRARVESAQRPSCLHAVEKIRWLLLSWGLPAGHDGDGESIG